MRRPYIRIQKQARRQREYDALRALISADSECEPLTKFQETDIGFWLPRSSSMYSREIREALDRLSSRGVIGKSKKYGYYYLSDKVKASRELLRLGAALDE